MTNKLLLFHCAENGKKALDRVGQLGLKLPEHVCAVELPCTGRVNESLVLEALQDGCDGVLVIACHKENCKYLDGNLRAEKRVARLKKILSEAGIEKRYMVDIIHIAPDEARKLARSIDEFYEKIDA